MNMELLSNNPAKIPFLCIVGMFVSYIWWRTLQKIRADISKLWGLIESYEKKKYENYDPDSFIKTNESRDGTVTSSGKLMMCIPALIGLIYFLIFQLSIVPIIQQMGCPCNPCGH